MWAEIYPLLVAGIGGFIGAALLLPTKLGDAVIQYRVGKSLEEFKNAQASALEGVKATLNHLGDRGKRSNEMEFQAIEKVWRAFVAAWLSTNTCIGSMTTIPDFAKMTEDDVRMFAAGSGFKEEEQKSLISSSDRQKEFLSILSWQRVNVAAADIYQARLTLREQRIFMPASLTAEFSEVIERMSGAQVQRRLSIQHPDIREYRYGKAQSDWFEESVIVFDKMALLANKRLFRDE